MNDLTKHIHDALITTHIEFIEWLKENESDLMGRILEYAKKYEYR